MKKIILLFSFSLFVLGSFAQYINVPDDTSFGFLAPENSGVKVTTVLFPISDADVYDFDTNDTLDLSVDQFYHILSVDTIEGSFYIDLTINDQVTAGALLLMKFEADTTARKVYFNTGFVTDSLTITANLNKKVLALFDGSGYNVIQ